MPKKPKKVKRPPSGIWKQVARVQRLGISKGMAGAGGGWLAVGIGAWGLQRVRKLAAKDIEVLISEPLKPGDRIVITNETTTHAEDEKARKKAKRQEKELAKAARRSGRRRSRSGPALVDAARST
jgi:hypothetical protein